MLRRSAPVLPLLAALCADAAGAHRLAFYVLLLAIPAAVVAGLDRFAAALDGTGDGRQAVAGAITVALVVLSEAVRGPQLLLNGAPALAISTLVVALVLAVVPVLRALAGAPLSPALRPPA